MTCKIHDTWYGKLSGLPNLMIPKSSYSS